MPNVRSRKYKYLNLLKYSDEIFVVVHSQPLVRKQRAMMAPHSYLQCLGPCLKSDRARTGPQDSLQYTNDGFQTEAEQNRSSSCRWNNALPRRTTFPLARGRPLQRRSHHCPSCGVYTNHVPKGSPSAWRGRGDGDDHRDRARLAKQRRKEGQKTVWFKESEDSSDIEVEIIPDTVGRVEEETEEELEVEMDDVVRDPAAPLRELDGGQEGEQAETRPEEGEDVRRVGSEQEKGGQDEEKEG